MPVRLIEVIAKAGYTDTVTAAAKQFNAIDCRVEAPAEDETQLVRILARSQRQQDLIDFIRAGLGGEDEWRIAILPVDAILPDPEPLDEPAKPSTATIREELYVEIERGAKVDTTFVLLVLLSTVVAAIGLFDNNVAVIIAAMVIAPLLGPNIALAFGSALGDRELIGRAALANVVGIALAIGGAAVAGFLLPDRFSGSELLSRTVIGYDSVALALAAGAAGAISLTTRVSSVLVGVMVAVALMPPAAATGYMLGTERFGLAAGSASLLAVNIVCINLSAQIVFLVEGVKPRTWIEQRAAKESTLISLTVWSVLLAALIAIIAWRHG